MNNQTGGTGMELDEIVRRFGALCGLTPEEAKAEEAQCAAALREAGAETVVGLTLARAR